MCAERVPPDGPEDIVEVRAVQFLKVEANARRTGIREALVARVLEDLPHEGIYIVVEHLRLSETTEPCSRRRDRVEDQETADDIPTPRTDCPPWSGVATTNGRPAPLPRLAPNRLDDYTPGTSMRRR